MKEIRFQVSMLIAQDSAATAIQDHAVNAVQKSLTKDLGYLPGISFLVKSVERVVPESALQVGDKIRLFDGAFGDAIVTEISAGKIYVQRPFLYGLDCSADVAGTAGIETFNLHTDSDKTVLLLERMRHPVSPTTVEGTINQ